MATDILLISTDRAADLERSLPAALAQDGARVTVIDNASSDGTAELTRRHGAQHLRLERRLSWAAANNAAIAATDGEAVLLLNADCFLAPAFLAVARPRLEEDRVGTVAPKLLRAGAGDAAQRPERIDAAGMFMDRRRKNGLVGHDEPAEAYARPGEAFGADGAAALYRREMLEDCAIDGKVLDEDFEKYASDVDLAWRAQLLGWRCVYEPRAVAHHVRSYGPGTRAEMPPEDRRQQFRNRYLMVAKNDTAAGLLRDLPRLAAYEVLALGFALLRERELLRGYREAARLVPEMRRRGRALRERGDRRRVPFGLAPQR